MMFLEANKYDVPCPSKRAMEENAIKALQDCEDEFDPFVGGIVPSSKAENVVLSSREYFLSTINSCCLPGNEKEKPALVDQFYETLCTNTRKENSSNTVNIFKNSIFFQEHETSSTPRRHAALEINMGGGGGLNLPRHVPTFSRFLVKHFEGVGLFGGVCKGPFTLCVCVFL